MSTTGCVLAGLFFLEAQRNITILSELSYDDIISDKIVFYSLNIIEIVFINSLSSSLRSMMLECVYYIWTTSHTFSSYQIILITKSSTKSCKERKPKDMKIMIKKLE